MRILYGITANGNGHLARSGRLVSDLRSRGHDVSLVISGQPGRQLLNQDELEPYSRFEGFSFAESGGKMSALTTLLRSHPFKFAGDVLARVPPGPYDLTVTDFEPITGWYALLHRIPSVGLCHMYAFLYPGVPRPPARWYERVLFRWLAPARQQLGIHWFPYHHKVIPPFVEPPLDVPVDERAVLVYLPWEDPATYLPAISSRRDYRFVVYGAGDNGPELASGLPGGETLRFKPPDREGFQRDLDSVGTVIANAGFALAGEALAKGKRLGLKAYAGQIEQEHNASEAAALGLATVVDVVDEAGLSAVLDSAAPRALHFPYVAPRFIQWLEAGAPPFDQTWHERFWAP